jgi:hypothetical protein
MTDSGYATEGEPRMINTQKLPISLCMIVRDEEKNIANALRSVCDLVSEMIVVDTGSVDKTIAIAQTFGAKIIEISWQDDFAFARNIGLQAASYEWILALDADQTLDENAWPALASALTTEHMAKIVTINLVTDDDEHEALGAYTALRLFRRHDQIRYRGIIHESIAESLLELGSTEWPDANITLQDLGYSSALERQRKRDRNLILLEKAYQENPVDLFVAYKLAITLPAERVVTRDEILDSTMKAVLNLSRDTIQTYPFMHRLLAVAVEAYVEQGRLCDAAGMALSMLPHLESSCYFTAGRAVARTGQLDLAFDLLTHYLTVEAQPINLAIQPDPDANKVEAYRWLAWVMRMAGDVTQTQSWLRKAIDVATADQKISLECELIRVSIATAQLKEAAQNIDRLYPLVKSATSAYSELMLISAELSSAMGDQVTANELACAALVPDDDRAATLLAIQVLNTSPVNERRLHELMPFVTGRTFESLAIRLIIAKQIKVVFQFKIPDATRALLEQH